MKINRYILLLILCAVSFTACVKETLYTVPDVRFEIDWSGISAANKAANQTDSAYLYLYPQFDYKADPIILKAASGEHICKLLPGIYKVLMHNAPLTNLYPAETETFESLSINQFGKKAISCSNLHLLPADRALDIEIVTTGNNVFNLKPITASKTIRFVIKTERFGDITSAYGVLGGVSTSMRVNNWARSQSDISSVRLPDFTITDSTLSGGQINVLGFNPATNPKEEDRILLTLYVFNKEVPYPLEQPVDLTDEVKDLTGDEIEITITVPYSPSTSAIVEIKQWRAGNELEIEIS